MEGGSAVEAAYAAAKLTGITQPAIAGFEAGGTTPTLPILERIANAFDTTLSVEHRLLWPRVPR